ncbi:MAG: hypothetical protein M3N54_08515, partial [Acidobacteriota bacterium]|nr:hypothetical protein [Acidobacteriota bacterium]
NIWDFITLMGSEFCPEAFGKDAIWAVLAGLAGRTEGEAPGHAYEPPNESLRGWTQRTASTIRARLVEALERDDAVELVCHLTGRIRLTPVDVHVYFSLDAHPIEIRLAGLDRNPGWIPAAGRYVHFHFD